MLKGFIDQLRADLSCEVELAPNAESTYSLVLEPALHVQLKESEESGITFFCELEEVPEADREGFFMTLMAANLFGRETGGNILGANREGKKITLSRFVSEQANYGEFHDALEEFVNYAEAWRDDIQEYSKK